MIGIIALLIMLPIISLAVYLEFKDRKKDRPGFMKCDAHGKCTFPKCNCLFNEEEL